MDQAIYGALMEEYVGGISQSQVSRIYADIGVQVQAYLNCPLEQGGYAYVFLDTTSLHVRHELLGVQVGGSEAELYWSEFIGSL